jgi:hypothetical protein
MYYLVSWKPVGYLAPDPTRAWVAGKICRVGSGPDKIAYLNPNR